MSRIAADEGTTKISSDVLKNDPLYVHVKFDVASPNPRSLVPCSIALPCQAGVLFYEVPLGFGVAVPIVFKPSPQR